MSIEFRFHLYILGSSHSLLKSVNVSRAIKLTPKAKTLYKTARRFRNIVSVYKKRSLSFKRRLRLAEKHFAVSNTGLKSEAVQFCLQQLSRKATKRRGMRYSLEEKLMALALYKTSGHGYRFLSKLFHLPSRRTLSRLLEGIPIESGINDLLMENLKKSSKNLKDREKLCMVMFDEISLMPHVSYNKHTQKIIGIQDGKICDHALVFMVRGVTKKWKQTISYTFCSGSTKATEIKKLLTSIIQKLKIAGM